MRRSFRAGLASILALAAAPIAAQERDNPTAGSISAGTSAVAVTDSATSESGYFGDTGCGCASECSQACGCDDRLFGIIARSDRCFSDFISPMTNPVFFEDPRTLTEARVIFLNHKTPPALGSDNVQLAAMQLRAALTDRLSFIATKDGYIFSQSPLLDDGWADVAAGLKYNLIHDCCTQTILSAGVTFELPVGSQRGCKATAMANSTCSCPAPNNLAAVTTS